MSVKPERAPKVTIKIPRNLYNRLSEIVTGTGFNSVTDFVVYVLRDLASTGTGATWDRGEDLGKLSRDEVEAIRKRLRSLGYL